MNYTDLQERFPGINIDKYSDKKKDDMIKKLIITEINKKNNEDLLSKDKDLIKKYTDLGIKKEKLFVINSPTVVWSKTKNCLLTGLPDGFDVSYKDGKMEYYAKDYKNNIHLSVKSYDNISVDMITKINNSNGIVIYGETYGKPHYRFDFIPDPIIPIGYQSGMKLSVEFDYATYHEPGYHITEFPKGILGEISKIEEELNELKDAEKQKSKVMMMIELSDLYGAIEEYCINQNLTMEDLKKFSDITKRAFRNGHRK